MHRFLYLFFFFFLLFFIGVVCRFCQGGMYEAKKGDDRLRSGTDNRRDVIGEVSFSLSQFYSDKSSAMEEVSIASFGGLGFIY